LFLERDKTAHLVAPLRGVDDNDEFFVCLNQGLRETEKASQVVKMRGRLTRMRGY